MKRSTNPMKRSTDPMKRSWVDYTPEDTVYELTMYEGGASIQAVELTRAEFLRLKAFLAADRGYVPAQQQHEPAEEKIAAQTSIDDVRAAF